MNYSLREYQKTLIENVRNEYRRGNKHVLVVSPCGSGKSVVIGEILRLMTIKNNKALFLVHRRELIEQIKKYTTGVNVEIAMVQTKSRHLGDEEYSIIVTDETHHSLANSYRKIYEHYKDAYRLGFTATPIRLNGGGLGDVYDVIVSGPTARWLIDNNYLAPYKYYAPKLVDFSRFKIRNGEYTKKSVEEEVSSILFGDVITHWTKLANGKKTIIYCNSVNTSEKVADEFDRHGIRAASLDATSNDDYRRDIIDKFKSGEITVLCNVELFGEGFDVPDCECVVLLRPTKSLSLYIQQSMRAMRYKDGKTAIIIDHVGNVIEHGLPDEEREWSLTPVKEDREKSESIKQCPKCFFVYKTGRQCPNCGYIPEVGARQIEQVDVELEEITSIEQARSMKDLYQLAKNKGYKKGWAYYQGISRGFINPKYNINVGGNNYGI